MFGSGWIDNGYLIFHPYITHTGTWLPAQCRGQCVTMDLTLGIPILPVPAPPPPYPPIKLVLSPLPLTLVWNITTTSPTRVVATFTGSFVRLRNQVLVDTVTVSDGYLDAQNSP